MTFRNHSSWFSVFLAMLIPWGCSEKPPATTKIVFSALDNDYWKQRNADLNENKERNRKKPAFTTEELRKLVSDPAHAAHLKLWRESRSYYALLELVEGIIEPEIGRMRRKDIRELLGEGSPDYPGSNGRLLEYVGERYLPLGAHLLIGFDKNDIVEYIEWVSE